MGTVIAYTRRTAEQARRTPPAAHEAGQIVIFPGVRIERHTPEQRPADPRRSGPRGRRRRSS